MASTAARNAKFIFLKISAPKRRVSAQIKQVSSNFDTSDAKSPLKLENERTTVCTKLLIKGLAPVDLDCTEKVKSAHVYEGNGTVYHFMLNQTNLQYNNNKYYMGQLLEDDKAAVYSVWFRWGRVGKTRQTALLPFGTDLQQAIHTFTKKFKDKTGNEWDEKESFVKQPGLYDLIQQDFGASNEALDDDTVEEKENALKHLPSKLPPKVLHLIKLICDIKAMEHTIREMNYDSRRSPLGKLTTAQIKAGYESLNIVSDCCEQLLKLKQPTALNSASGERSAKRPKRAPSTAGMCRKLHQELLTACNDFYTRIPHDFGMRVPPLIDNKDALSCELDLMKALEDIEVAFKILKEEKNDNTNPADRHYAGLQCEISALSENDVIFQIIKRYIEMTHAPTHSTYKLEVMNVFTCDKHGEVDAFTDVGNRLLLWHGSRLTNWMGILGRGLRIAPTEAPCTGYMFGKGVYFADCASKSANYAYASRDRNVGLLALCEVSLGEFNELIAADYAADKLPAGKHSVKGIGQNTPDRSTWVTLDDGVVVPCGKLIPSLQKRSTSLLYNEYVVYNPAQIRLRYLVQVKFNYKY